METSSANSAAMPASPELSKEIRTPHDGAYNSTLSLNDIGKFENEASVEHVKMIGHMTLGLGYRRLPSCSPSNPKPRAPSESDIQ
jgi:hypothetical protein